MTPHQEITILALKCYLIAEGEEKRMFAKLVHQLSDPPMFAPAISYEDFVKSMERS